MGKTTSHRAGGRPPTRKENTQAQGLSDWAVRYKLKGDVTWCFNWRNGWVRFWDVIVRWNTNWTPSYTLLSVTYTK